MILSDFRIALPKFRTTQQETIDWLKAAHEVSGSGLSRVVDRYACKPNRLGFRYHSLEDFNHTDWAKMRIFNLKQNPSGSGMQERMNFFTEATLETFRRFYAEDLSPPTEIIHVTCTGYVSPSAAQRLVSEKRWGEKTTVTHAYHMGCYASIPAINMALHTPSRTDIVHTELCTLHFNPSIPDVEQLVVQGLFSDGFIRYSAFSDECFHKTRLAGLEVVSIREELVPETSNDMTWTIADNSLNMTLARDVSKSIGSHLPGFLERLCGKNLSLKNPIFAIHPGGPKIIDDIAAKLGLNEDQIRFSRKILFEHGNMSSATLPHIWSDITNDPSVPEDHPIISLAFGPGLTIAGGYFTKRGNR